MKSILIVAAVLGAMAAPLAADEIEDSMQAALDAYRKGDVAAAKGEIDYIAQLLAQQQAQNLSSVLPAPLAGWTRQDNNDVGVAPGMFGGGLAAGATYSRDGRTVELQVVADSPFLAAMAAMYANSSMAGAMGKLKRIAGHKAIETDQGELQAMIGNRFLVQLSGDAPGEDKEAYFSAIDFAALERF